MKYQQDQVWGPLYDPAFEHDNCGIGAVVDIKGRKSHQTVDDALKIVEKLEHRAGKGRRGQDRRRRGHPAPNRPPAFSPRRRRNTAMPWAESGTTAWVCSSSHRTTLRRNQAKKMFELIVDKEGMEFIGWRTVPVRPEVLGHKALDKMPCIEQAFVRRPAELKQGLDFDRRLYIARREFEQSNDNTYVVSLSSRTIVYKGMFLVGQLRQFYPGPSGRGLRVRHRAGPLPVLHQHQPLAGSGRTPTASSSTTARSTPSGATWTGCWPGRRPCTAPSGTTTSTRCFPVVNVSGSDSAMLDNTLEFLVMSGMDLPLAVMICIPEPWSNDENMSREKRDLYQYYATMMEPWDGPASILFSDGDHGGRGAGPQRPAALPVLCHRRRSAHSVLRGGRAGHRSRPIS